LKKKIKQNDLLNHFALFIFFNFFQFFYEYLEILRPFLEVFTIFIISQLICFVCVARRRQLPAARGLAGDVGRARPAADAAARALAPLEVGAAFSTF